MELIPLSAIIPTRNRSSVLQRTLYSLGQQNCLPSEILIIDGSEDEETKRMLKTEFGDWKGKLIHERAKVNGAAVQRNQGVGASSQPFILFMDDDILLEENCIERLWKAIQSDSNVGGVSAMVTNQKYHSPGTISRILFRILNGKKETTYAGKCLGPGLNLLPEDRNDLPEIVSVDWLNTTCTVYRKGALPSPPFSENFVGYSLMEDLALSLQVGKKWKLANARTARIFHDSQPGGHKSNKKELAKMELLNRYFIMTKVLGRTGLKYYCKLALLQIFDISSSLTRKQGWLSLVQVLAGKAAAVKSIVTRTN